MPDIRVVITTLADEDSARTFVGSLVEERLVACGSLLPGVCSIYRWEGKVLDEREWMVVLKTDASVVPELLRRAAEIHPYEVPELLALPVEAGFGPYLEWVSAEVGD